MTNKTLRTGRLLLGFEFNNSRIVIPTFSNSAPVEVETLMKKYNGVIHNSRPHQILKIRHLCANFKMP